MRSPRPSARASWPIWAPYRSFEPGDGKTVMMGLQTEREWKDFCEKVLRQPQLATEARFDSNARRSEHRSALQEFIRSVFVELSVEQVVGRLEEAQIADAGVNTMAELRGHPQLQARERFAQVESPAGPLAALLPPGVHSGFTYRMDPVLAVGEHTEAVLRERGRSAGDIAALRQAGVI